MTFFPIFSFPFFPLPSGLQYLNCRPILSPFFPFPINSFPSGNKCFPRP